MNDNESNLKCGSRLQGGKYVIEKKLGQGGFGITYSGLQVGLNRRVAIKEFFMKDHCGRDSATSHVTVGSEGGREIVEKSRKKFIKEAQTIAQLDNPRVIKIYDIFEENGTAYYVMEFIEGGSLEAYVNKRQRLDENSALKFVGQIADALTYIHGKNILHLDVKPSNVLLRKSGEAVLIDFGISKRYDEQGGQTSTTPVGRSKGYAPFEQYTEGGVSHFDQSTDVYSLGAVLYKLLTGERPEEAPVLIDEELTIPPYVSARCAGVIRKAMSVKRSGRYQSAAEMKTALCAGGGEEDVTIIDTDDGKKGGKAYKAYAAIAVSAAVIIVAVFFALRGHGGDDSPVDDTTDTIPTVVVNTPPAPSPSSPSTGSPGTSSGEEVVTPVAGKPTLTLSCKTSGASLYVDGKKKGTGKWSGELSAGSHKLEARLDGYQTETETLDMSDGGTYSHAFPALTAVTTKSETTTSTVSSTTSTASSGKINGHEYVDLGLSVKWATCNVGASSPTVYGNYYAWGETSTKSTYTDENRKAPDKSIKNIGGNVFYDAARAVWGGSWRLPTIAEFQELMDNCKSEWTTVNGVKGSRFTSKKNGKSIFLPAAGWMYGSSLHDAGGDGYYWSSSTADYNYYDNYYGFRFYDSNQGGGKGNPSHGRSVRPVSE